MCRDYVADLMSPESIRAAGYFGPVSVGRLVEKCRQGRAAGFADNQAFVGILSTMLVHHGLQDHARRDAGATLQRSSTADRTEPVLIH